MMGCMSRKCPRRCQRRSFKATVVTSTLAQPTYTDDDVLIDIYYGKFHKKVYTEQVAVELAAFVANLGGIIGAWTGMSSFTFVQLVIFTAIKLSQLLLQGFSAICSR
jgi:Amiloride-sensitive sodium channel